MTDILFALGRGFIIGVALNRLRTGQMGLTTFRPGQRLYIPGVQVITPHHATSSATGIIAGISNVAIWQRCGYSVRLRTWRDSLALSMIGSYPPLADVGILCEGVRRSFQGEMGTGLGKT